MVARDAGKTAMLNPKAIGRETFILVFVDAPVMTMARALSTIPVRLSINNIVHMFVTPRTSAL